MIDIGTPGVCTDSPIPEGHLGGSREGKRGGVRLKRRRRLWQRLVLRERERGRGRRERREKEERKEMELERERERREKGE